ncbi:MAG: methylated-DNA--[protein]-cysteine S-methyltransferase [Rhodospirillaceae bacterium]|nr:methylated-DNA--[protein]-cysteine S-methyltransferase [Rhodospirillaceae bacterium]
MNLYFDTFKTPLGDMTAGVTEAGDICLLDFSDCRDRSDLLLQRRFGSFVEKTRQNPQGIRDRVSDYFAGRKPHTAFHKLALDTGGTPFQISIWSALRQIPYGDAISYSQLAARVSAPRAARAAGTANGQNPVAIIVPCHRVIAKNGTLAGYAGGVWRKQWLLDHERGAASL